MDQILDILEVTEEEEEALAAVAIAVSNTDVFFNPDEIANDDQNFVNRDVGARDQLGTLLQTPSLFKVLTNFSGDQFEELCSKVCPTIMMYARSTGQLRSGAGRPPKLTPQQRLLHLIFYMKHDNVVRLDGFNWNWAKSSACDDSLFVADCIIATLQSTELKWPNQVERTQLGRRLAGFLGCIGVIDGTLVQIPAPSAERRKEFRRLWYNGRKAMYCMNNTVVVDHNGLFIFIDPGYPGTFHDVTCLRRSSLYQDWRQFFEHRDDYFEYLLGDPGYVGEDMFIMRRVGRREAVAFADGDMSVIDVFNAVHAGCRVKIEWGIFGLKNKWIAVGFWR